MRTLRQWRETRGLSYRELAHRAGVARWTVTRIESGRAKRVNRSTVACLAGALDVDPGQIVEFAGVQLGPPEPGRATRLSRALKSDRRATRPDVVGRTIVKNRVSTPGQSDRRATVAERGNWAGASRRDGKVRVAVIGVGNCASALVQGVEYYKTAPVGEAIPGLMHVDLGGYHVGDVEFSAAFDIDVNKVGKDLSEAIFTEPNNTIKFADVPRLDVPVHRGMTHDGLGKYLSQIITKAPGPTADIVQILRDTQTDVVVSYLPVGSEMATKWYAEQVLEAGCGFINCIPVFIASSEYWSKRFSDRGLPIIGDDIKSQVGATITHRVLTRLFADRGVQIDRTYQLNFGGNTDFMNMLERERLDSKKISKTQAVTSQLAKELPNADVHVGPSDYVPWLEDRKWCHIRIEGTTFGDVPLNMELKLEVWDSPNSAGVVIDAVRCAKLALDNGVHGPLLAPSAYFMKSPPEQYHDDVARDRIEEFIDVYGRKHVTARSAPATVQPA
jgi:myo-inositol-1-phosphate synthase